MNTSMFSSISSEWETPQELFDSLNSLYGFTIDVAATDDNAKCKRYFTKENDGLSQSWAQECVWCNPPYGREIGKWVRKAFQEAKQPGTVVVMLLPARTDTAWFHDCCRFGDVIFLRGRLKFINRTFPSYREDGDFKRSPAQFPSMIVKFGGKINETDL